MNFKSNTLLRTRLRSLIGLAALSLTVAACGDPGTTSEVPNGPAGPVNPPPSGPDDPGGPDTEFGVLRGASPIVGVDYQTDTHEGVTDEQGRFFYESDETVSFWVGGTLLGEAPAQPVLTPFELVQGAEIVTGTGPIQRALETDSFRRVLAIEMFLESLDLDGEPRNGIEIPTAVSERLEDIEIDLGQRPKELFRAPALRKLLADATEIFGEPRAVVSATMAATHLYEGLGVDPQISQPVRSELDVHVDGSVDRISTIVYDDEGQLVRYEEEIANFGVDGPDRIERIEYDDHGNPTSMTLTKGDLEWFTRWTYGPLGERTSVTEGQEGVGTTEMTRWEFDKYGNTVLMERDEDGDGSPNAVEAYAYDEEGRLIRTDRINRAGEITSAITREYDEAGRLALTSYIDRDGKVWSVRFVTYDDAGRKIREVVTYEGDVNPDRAETFEYDDSGRLTREERDDGNDGTADFVRIYVYDDEGNVVYEEADEGADRVSVAVIRRFYDAQGRLTRVERDTDGDGRVDSVRRFEFDAAGNTTRYEWDRDGDGSPNRVQVATYDELGNQLEFERWTDEPGLDSIKYTRTFAPTGWGYLMTFAGHSVHGFRVAQF
jgi:YD repeat-containing protein